MPNRPNFPIPEDIYAEPFCLCIQVPNDPTWKRVVAGLLDELNQWYNWQRDEARSGKECAQVWRDLYSEIDWTTMSCCCGETVPVQYRYTEFGVLQRSVDGGVTWVDSPEYDPRVYSPQYPPIVPPEGVDPRCLAASSAQTLIEEQVGGQLTDDMSRFTLAELISTWVTTYLETSNPFQALMQVVANQIFALVIATLIPALTDEVYDDLRCIFFNHMDETGLVSVDEWEAVRADILSMIGGIAGIFLEHLVYLLGAGGLTNICRAGAGDPAADCTACDNDCSDIWNVAGDNPQYGVIIERGENYFILESGYDTTFGRYTMNVNTGDDNTVCCNWHEMEAVVGTTGIPYVEYCGSNDLVSAGLSHDIDVHVLYYFGASPFTWKVVFNPG